MSSVWTLSRPEPSRDAPPAAPETAPAAVEFHYTRTDRFPALLRQLSASLLVKPPRWMAYPWQNEEAN